MIRSFRLLKNARYFSSNTRIKWIILDDQGKQNHCEGSIGSSVLESSINSGFQFEKVCGGNAQCLTCHVHIPPEMESHPAYEEPSEMESDAMMFTVERSEYSRLGCQMVVSEALDGRTLIFKGQ